MLVALVRCVSRLERLNTPDPRLLRLKIAIGENDKYIYTDVILCHPRYLIGALHTFIPNL